jgi:ABC-type lipoprotein release transport system permease subunit
MLAVRMAWRNAWRHPRRTGILIVAVATGIAGTFLSMALNYGMVLQMVETAIHTDLGHVQIHAPGFDQNPGLEVRLEDGASETIEALDEIDGVRAWSRRVRAQGLLSSPRASAGVSVVGVEPEREARITRIARSVTVGAYLDGDARRVLLGESLAGRLSVGVGDKVVLSVQELSGDMTGEALRVGGLFSTESGPLDKGTVFLHIEESQALLGLGAAVSEVVVLADSRQGVSQVRDALAVRLAGSEVRSWEELQPALRYMVDVFDQMAIFVYIAIFVAMAFGIANVLLMTVFERTREIGVLTAIGYGSRRLVASIVIEALLVTLVGVALGFALALLGAWALQDGIDVSAIAGSLDAYSIDPVIVPVVRAADFPAPIGVAILTAAIAAAWPAWRAVRLRPAEAIRQT